MKLIIVTLCLIFTLGVLHTQEKISITKSATEIKGVPSIIHEDCTIQPVDLPQTNVVPVDIRHRILDDNRNFMLEQKDSIITTDSLTVILKPGEYAYYEIDAEKGLLLPVDMALPLSPESQQAIAQSPIWLREQLALKFRELRNHSLQTEKQYAGIINNTDFPYKDEVAFTIANMSYQSLVDSRFSSDKQAIVRNAEMIYLYADSLKYVEIVEQGDFESGDYSTTTRYRIYDPATQDTVWSEIPAQIYYWYIVHPKMDQEGVYVKDNSNDASGQRTYDYAWRQFIWANPDPTHDYKDVNITTSKGTVTTIPRFGELIKQATILWDREKTYLPFNRPFAGVVSALDIIGNWCSRALPVDVTLPRAFQPNQILMKHNGMCNEDAFLVASACRTALIPIIYLGTWCEDHVFGSVWDNGWNHFEFFRGGLSESGNDFYGITNMLDGGSYGWKTSMVEGFRPDGYAINFTQNYTKTSKLEIRVMDKTGKPITGAFMTLFASPNAYNANYLKCGTAYTDDNGYAYVDVGEGKKYLANAYHPEFGWAPVDSTQAYVITSINTQAGYTYRVNMVYNNIELKEPEVELLEMNDPDKYFVNLKFSALDIFSAQNQRDSQKSRFYYWDDYNMGDISVIMCDSSNFEKFKSNQPFAAYLYSTHIISGNINPLLKKNEKNFLILSNNGNSNYYQRINTVCKLVENKTLNVELNEEYFIRITPNPASDYIEISNVILSEAKIRKNGEANPVIKIYDVLGEVVLRNPLYPPYQGDIIRLDVSGLAPGVYFVKIGGKMLKFVKL